jgi:hypothetical protein
LALPGKNKSPQRRNAAGIVFVRFSPFTVVSPSLVAVSPPLAAVSPR